ncbi:uncharacterized protein LOC115634497 [Scaptodrosophila lebanonensis]|uniref:Uncharacterized protein LOC115634497 n=1 Tax=Drosophila lebanonensis TaxID=7225 RepID=A0A6J2UI54_DROLE|nr:uncharacterized protein LOC115634497 [Scaptodrosophila lebanonensis]
MGCNTSQELKTKDGSAIDAVNGDVEASAPSLECSADALGSNHANHAKSNSIISNGDAKSAAKATLNGSGGGVSAAASASSTGAETNGAERSCDKAEITEFNDAEVEDEVPTQY